MHGAATAEFARPIEIARLNRGEQQFKIAANPEERAALARRFDLIGLDRLEADVRLAAVAGGLVRLEADFAAEAIQSCVVTLTPVKARVAERFTLLYGAGGEASEVTLDGAAETIEPITDGVIDIGEAVAQQLSLALDPFPHAPGAALARPAGAPEPAGESPFKALAQLRIKNNSKD
jgi:uncharacterized metal-binding protein YceD (DUF177 family)